MYLDNLLHMQRANKIGQMHKHYMIHKPYGYLSQFIYPQTRRRKPLLGELHDFAEGTMAVGRLDVKTEGLMVLTTDGKVSEYVRRKAVEKEYHVLVDGIPTEDSIRQLAEGVTITVDGAPYRTHPAIARLLETPPSFPTIGWIVRDPRHGPKTWISLTIGEGKNRQVRKMTASVGHPTLRLIRVRIGQLQLGDLPSGGVVELDTVVL